MPDMAKTAMAIRKRLDEKESARENALQVTRKIVRSCRSAIASIHGGRDPSADISDARNMHESLKRTLENHQDLLRSGYVLTAQQELAEAEILTSLLSKQKPPTPEDIGIPDETYITGLADVIGELRRIFLTSLMNDRPEEAEMLLSEMESLFAILMTFDYPDALVAVKRKQDIARSILERCRGEIALAAQMLCLRRELSEK